MSAKKMKKRRGIYLLPNLITSASLFLGFWAMILAIEGRYEMSVLAIYFCLALDFLDGKIARVTSSETRFGAEYDSLSDVVVFGCAPALLLYQWHFSDLGTFWARTGWLIAFVYLSTTAMRLARFNAAAGNDERPFFLGFPCPAAATFLVSSAWICENYGGGQEWINWLIVAAMAMVSLLMVSNFGYYSFKHASVGSRVSLLALFLLILTVVLFSLELQLFVFLITIIYLLSPLPRFAVKLLRRQKPSDKTFKEAKKNYP